jgi:hypothetical protein
VRTQGDRHGDPGPTTEQIHEACSEAMLRERSGGASGGVLDAEMKLGST